MPSALTQTETVVVTGLSNKEFLACYAKAGRLGLSGGITLIDKAICRAQRHIDSNKNWGAWSHAFLFQGQRLDGHHWVIESDLQVHRKHIQLGVQENRISKYYDEDLYSGLAVLDFGLDDEQVMELVKEGLELVANRARYSVRELFGTLIALRHPASGSRVGSRTSCSISRVPSPACWRVTASRFTLAGLPTTEIGTEAVSMMTVSSGSSSLE